VSRRRVPTLLSVGALLFGCGAERRATEPPSAPSPSGAPTAPHSEPLAQPPRGELEADEVVQRALAMIAEIRELGPKAPVRGEVIARQAMLDYVQRQFRTELPPEVVEGSGEVLVALGAVPPEFDYERALLDLMSAQLAGFYEPKDKTMYLAADLEGAEREATLAHELVHALQDQHYDLGPRIKYREDASDEQSAAHALAEGDATSAMLDQMLMSSGKRATDIADAVLALQVQGMAEMAPETAHVPSILKRSLISPYLDGIGFVHWARRRGGWAAVDAAWQRAPATTEQLLHPEKWLSGEPALTVPIPAPPSGDPLELVYHDVMGEQSLRLVFEEWVPRRTAVEAASGWGGDRVAVYKTGDRAAMAWHLRYDDEASAERGFAAAVRGTQTEDERARPAPTAPGACAERGDVGPLAVVRSGSDVVIAAGPYGGSASKTPCSRALAWARRVAAQR